MRRRLRFLPLAVVTGALSACYTYVPLRAPAPPVGETLAFEITDQGRVGLGQRMGSGVARIEGRLTGVQDNNYVVNVFSVANIDGTHALWSGEPVNLQRDFVGAVKERKLSRTRSFLLAGGIVGGITAFAVGRSLIGGGRDDREPDPGPGPVAFGWRFRFGR